MKHKAPVEDTSEGMSVGTSPVQTIILVLFAAGFSAIGNLIIKSAVKALGGMNLEGSHLVQTLFHLFTNPGVVIGLALYLLGFILWAKVLSTVDISIAYPIFISLAFTLVVIGSRVIFNETLSLLKIAGIVVIACGIILASRG